MIGNAELQLEVVPEVLKAIGGGLPGASSELSIKVPLWSPSTRKELVRRLAQCPSEVYALIQGRAPEWFSEMELLPTDLEQTLSSEGANLDIKAEDLLKQIEKGLAEQPALVLKLRGFPKEQVLEAVFARWAEVAAEEDKANGSSPSVVLATEIARLERKGPAISSGEWLAEAAAEGSLHQPGTSFHEVADRPFPKNPVVMPAAEDWQALLPQTPKVQEGLALVMRRVAEAAAQRARPQ